MEHSTSNNRERLARLLSSGATQLQRRFASIKILVFGSAVADLDSASDIDILLVSEASEHQAIRDELHASDWKLLPIDFTLLTPAEAEETRFAQRYGCVAFRDLPYTDFSAQPLPSESIRSEH